MLGWIVWTGFGAGSLLLLAAGFGHVLRRRHLDAVLTTHRLPATVRRLVVTWLGVAEIAVGVAGIATVLTNGSRLAAGVTALFYGAFTGYLIRLLRTAPGASCGCFGSDEPAGLTTVARSCILGLCAVGAATIASPATTLPARAGLLAAAAVVALMASTIPALLALKPDDPNLR